MAITNLTNTSWYFNDTLTVMGNSAGQSHVYVNFQSNGQDFVRFVWDDDDYISTGRGLKYITNSGEIVFAYNRKTGVWLNDNYKSVSFYGEPTDYYDFNKEDFISWLDANGTQLKATNLTDTTWNVPVGWEAEEAYGEFSINGSINSESIYDSFRIGYYSGWSDATDWYEYIPEINSCCFQGANFDNDETLIFNITDGTDTTNPKLIAWLSKYGELEGGEEEKTPTLTYDLSQLDLPEGTHTITVIAKADGYADSEPSNAVEYVAEAKQETVSITLKGKTTSSASGNYTHPCIKFGSAPTSESDYDYYNGGSSALINGSGEVVETYPTPIAITTSPIAYVWQDYVDSAAGYKINDGSTVTTGVGYENATQITLNDGDALTIVATYD